MANFSDFLNDVKTGITQVGTTQFGEFAAQAKQDGQSFLASLEDDLRTWTQQLAAGLISPADFAFLVRGKKDLAAMSALTEAGLGAARVDTARNAIIDVILTAATKAIAPTPQTV